MIGLALRGLLALVALVAATLLLLGGTTVVSAQEATPVVSEPVPAQKSTASDAHDVAPANLNDVESADDTATMTLTATQASGTVVVTLHNQSGALNPGGCMTLDGPTTVIACDGRDGDAADGRITLVAPAGEYALVLVEAPAGFQSGVNLFVLLGAGQTVPVRIDLVPGGQDVFVTTVDDDGTSLSGACYRLVRSVGNDERGELVSTGCDGGDGRVRFPGIGPGGYFAVQTLAPGGLPLADDTYVIVPFSGTGPISVTVENVPDVVTSTLTVRTTSGTGSLLAGACYGLFADTGGGSRGAELAVRCDAADGLADGQTVFDALAPGAVVLAQTTAPAGYTSAADQRVMLVAGETPVVEVTVDPGGSDITVRTVEATSGALLPGACFALHRDAAGAPSTGTLVTSRCDADGGAGDGTTAFPSVAPGTYLLVQTTFPPQHTADVDTTRIAVDGLAVATATVDNRPQTLPEQMVEVLISILRDILGV